MDQKIVFQTKDIKRYKFPTHINDLVVDRTQASHSEVFFVEIEPGKSVHHHKHDDTEQIFYLIKGAGTLLLGEEKKEIPVRAGDVVRMPLATWHSIRNDHETTIVYLSIDCFGAKKPLEDSWDEHVKVMCKENGWDYDEVVFSGKDASAGNK